MEAGAQAARSRALAVLRVRGRALAVALLPAGTEVILLTGASTGRLVGPGWDAARWVVGVLAVLVLLAAAGIAVVVARARPAMSPTVPVPEGSAPDLYGMVRDLADRLDVPAPSAIALTPDCDSWLEDRAHSAHGPPPRPAPDEIAGPGRRRTPVAPVLVIGSPFLWWMRVGELRAVLAPVIAGTGPSAHPDIAAARRFVRGLDAAVAVASTGSRRPLTRGVCAALGWVARLLLRGCREHATQMERGVAAAAAERAQAVDYGLRIVAQEQVGLAYAGWDRLLTRVALPAWRMGRWPSRLDAGVVAALTELSRRDRLAEGFASRLGERPACDLLEEPGAVDEAASLLAARLFHGGPAESGPDWAPVDWQAYPEEVVDRTWRAEAARLHRVLDTLGVRPSPDPRTPDPGGPTLARVLDHLTATAEDGGWGTMDADAGTGAGAGAGTAGPRAAGSPSATGVVACGAPGAGGNGAGADVSAVVTRASGSPSRPDQVAPGAQGAVAAGASGAGTDGAGPEATGAPAPSASASGTDGAGTGPTDAPAAGPAASGAAGTAPGATGAPTPSPSASGTGPSDSQADDADGPAPTDVPAADTAPAAREPGPQLPFGEEEDPTTERSAALAAGLSAELAREEAAGVDASAAGRRSPVSAQWDEFACGLPLFPLQPQRTARELLADHVTAMVCCAAVDTAGAVPALDWLDGPSLLLGGERAADLAPKVLTLIEEGDPGPLRDWLAASGIRPEKPVRLV
ncbi:integral membrane protein [Streptomyces hygroscopicus subsp. jinggangensis 5008]|nr:integral membrane protein [Streptomyces hygroscopicus subsp. jinggangensis 5008]AGF64450.1 integral membrane protein [Streptomyces hygroscopicus subsp. jinggangensis TL01]